MERLSKTAKNLRNLSKEIKCQLLLYLDIYILNNRNVYFF